MQIQRIRRYHFAPIRTAAIENEKQKVTSIGEDTDKLGPGAPPVAPRKLKTEFLQNPAIPLSGICPAKLKAGCQREICIPCSQQYYSHSQNADKTRVSTDKRLSKTWHLHMMECYSA